MDHPVFPGTLPAFPETLPAFPGTLPVFPGTLPVFPGTLPVLRPDSPSLRLSPLRRKIVPVSSRFEFLTFTEIGLYHPLDGITNLKYKLLCFLTRNKKISKRKALAFY